MTDDQQTEVWRPDKDFLKNVLRNCLGSSEMTIKECMSRIATNKGDNYTSDMFRVTMKFEERQEPLTIIVKRLLNTGSAGDVISNSSVFFREEQMIKAVMPEVHAVLKKVFPDVERFAARYVYSTPGILAMEDLQLAGFQMAERRLGLDLNHCSLVVRTLARYHAASVLLMERKSVDFSLFKNSFFEEESIKPAAETMFNGMLNTLAEELKNVPSLQKYSEKLSKIADQNFLPLLKKAVEDHDDDDFLVLMHGDLWINNILFRYSSSGKPDGVRFVDLQLSTITSPCIDLCYFLTASSNETVRTTCTDKLLQEYHTTLCETMAALKCSTRPPTLEKLKQDFDKRTPYSMFSAFNVMPIVLAEPGQFDLEEILHSGKPQNELFRSKAYLKAMEWFLPLYERKGFL